MMKKISLIWTLILLVLPALAEHFPLCMYGVNRPQDITLLRKAGFTCIHTYQQSPEQLNILARAAQKQQMQIVFSPNQVIGSAWESAAQTWPVLAWYLVDEPDVARWSRDRVIETREKTRIAFPQHSNTLVIGQGKTRIPYYDLPDQLMVDWYPVPHLALTSFGDNVRWAKEGQTALGAATKPLWGVVQIFNWKEFKQYRPDNDRIGRFPTKQEIRFMSYDGIINGASGLFYFIFTTNDIPLPQAQPSWWKRVTAVSKELARLRPVLEQGILQPNPVEVAAPLALQTRRYKNHLYLILLNRSDHAVSVPAALASKKYKLLFAKNIQQDSLLLPAYSVQILKAKIDN